MKKSVVMLVAVVLCIAIIQSAFAFDTTDRSAYIPFEIKDGYTLDEALWIRPTTYILVQCIKKICVFLHCQLLIFEFSIFRMLEQ